MDKQTYLDQLASAPPLSPSALKGSVESYREKVLSRLLFLLEDKPDDEEMTPDEMQEVRAEVADNFIIAQDLFSYIPKGQTVNPIAELRDNLLQRAVTPVVEPEVETSTLENTGV